MTKEENRQNLRGSGQGAPLYMALLHDPVYNRRGETVTAAVTNLDIHDLARAAMTFGIRRFYVVTPVEEQRALVHRIVGHWMDGYGGRYNPGRRKAFETITITSSLEEAGKDVERETGSRPLTVATGAALEPPLLTFAELGTLVRTGERPCLILFGTAWGLAKEAVSGADRRLEPISGVGEYNHLSVRSAAAIVLDRIRKNL